MNTYRISKDSDFGNCLDYKGCFNKQDALQKKKYTPLSSFCVLLHFLLKISLDTSPIFTILIFWLWEINLKMKKIIFPTMYTQS